MSLHRLMLNLSGRPLTPSILSSLSTGLSPLNISSLEFLNSRADEVALLEALRGSGTLSAFTAERPLTVYLKVGYDADGKNKLDDASYLEHALGTSPLMVEAASSPNLKVVPLLHNPETFLQTSPSIMKSLSSSLSHLPSYGLSTNGLPLPPSHPLHFPQSLLPTSPNFTHLHAPLNPLEPAYSVAPLPGLTRVAYRPLTCYPCLGTSDTGDCYSLVSAPADDAVGGGEEGYRRALNVALGHFDVSSYSGLDADTLEGVSYVRNMIQGLDGREFMSFKSYERHLDAEVVPGLHGMFEEVDEETSEVLTEYFKALGAKVRR
eukprot:CAMPEP_0182457016 /NCGR_PEP_ID=MMETSP1319-20130603/2696_1 /TAXON_ID=172717 /ORGANISM="Bolidomonas pacifica, Strain RCC208" /LENGTH=319 /DNA_ID=CAMNT_0024655395 /DNA_START=108 /DNA_END=1064 /DNA_ORIENTATION=-